MRKVFGFLGFILVCGIALAGGTLLGWLNSSDVVKSYVGQVIWNVQPKQVFQNQDTLYLLILGCDEDRDPRTKVITKKFARSDMMLVAKLDFKKNLITGLSIPRDLEVDLPGYGPHKINAYHDLGGKPLAKQAVEYTLPVAIDRVIVLDYDAFKKVVDMVGGVEIYVDKKLKYTDTWGDLYVDLDVGRHHLNGEEAMGFVRIRKVDNDFGRQKRQKEFLVSLKDAMAKKPEMMPRIADQVVQLFGGELQAGEVAALIRYAQKIGPDNIKMDMIPVVDRKGTYNLYLDHTKLDSVLIKYGFLPDPTAASNYQP